MVFTQLNTKQKVIFAALVVILLVLVWQIYELMGMGASNPATGKVVMQQQVGAMQMQQQHYSAAAVSAQLSNTPASAVGQTTAVNPDSNSQSEYLRLVNEYQMAQLQRMIAEDNEAIAIAKRNAIQAGQDTAKIVGGSADDLTAGAAATNTDQNSQDYSLVYTGQQGDGQWTATLKKNGQTFDVVTGGQLPDGFHIQSIDENGVVLTQGTVKKLVTFSGVMQSANSILTTPPDAPTQTPAPTPTTATSPQSNADGSAGPTVTSLPPTADAGATDTSDDSGQPAAVLPANPSPAQNPFKNGNVVSNSNQAANPIPAPTPGKITVTASVVPVSQLKEKMAEAEMNLAANSNTVPNDKTIITAASSAVADNDAPAPAATLVAPAAPIASTTPNTAQHKVISVILPPPQTPAPQVKVATVTADANNVATSAAPTPTAPLVAPAADPITAVPSVESLLIATVSDTKTAAVQPQSETTASAITKMASRMATKITTQVSALVNQLRQQKSPEVKLDPISTASASDSVVHAAPASTTPAPVAAANQDNYLASVITIPAEGAPTVDALTPVANPVPAASPAPAVNHAPAVTANRHGYTIQLTEDRVLDDVLSFIRDKQLGSEAHYYKIHTQSGNVRFVLTYGQYPSRAAAQVALENLPAHLKGEGAYIIAYSDIKNAIEENS